MDSDSDPGPDVVVQLQRQTTTDHLSDDEFTSKAAAAAGRIKAWLPAQLSADDEQKRMSGKASIPRAQLRKLATIAEDEPTKSHDLVPHRKKESVRTLNTPQDSKTKYAHPGEIVPIPPQLSFTSLKSIILRDTANDLTVGPSSETGSTAAELKLTPSPQKTFLTQNADGSYKEVDISEVAPWLYLYQVDQDAEVLAKTQHATYKTPPSTLSRASAGGFLSPKTSQVLALSADDK
jgi:hypothetical protein